MSDNTPKNKKACVHCGKYIQTGGAYIRHERSCAKDHGLEPKTSLGGSLETKPDPPGPTSPWILWNRGTWRGWAVGRVSKRTASIVKLETPHLGEIVWSRSAFEDDVKEGKIFFVNPEQIVQALITQMEELEVRSEKDVASTAEQVQESLRQSLFLLEKLKGLT